MNRLVWLLVCLWLCACTHGPTELDAGRLSAEIFRLTNALRSEKQLPAFARLDELDQLSQQQSDAMAARNYFDHTDPDGNSPADRLDKFAPHLLCASSGENIALRSREGDEAAMAQILVALWRDSPEHYENILNPAYRQLGVAIHQQDGKVWATQTFASAVARLTQSPGKVRLGDTVSLQFDYLGEFPTGELSAFWTVPDPKARIPLGNGAAAIGKGPLQPHWSDDRHFDLTVTTNYGRGAYKFRLGHQSAYYGKEFSFEADEG